MPTRSANSKIKTAVTRRGRKNITPKMMWVMTKSAIASSSRGRFNPKMTVDVNGIKMMLNVNTTTNFPNDIKNDILLLAVNQGFKVNSPDSRLFGQLGRFRKLDKIRSHPNHILASSSDWLNFFQSIFVCQGNEIPIYFSKKKVRKRKGTGHC